SLHVRAHARTHAHREANEKPHRLPDARDPPVPSRCRAPGTRRVNENPRFRDALILVLNPTQHTVSGLHGRLGQFLSALKIPASRAPMCLCFRYNGITPSNDPNVIAEP